MEAEEEEEEEEDEEEGIFWLRADLRRLRGRDQVRGSKGLASRGPFLGAPAGPRGMLNMLGARGQGLGIP